MKSSNTLQDLKELITDGEAWDLAHLMAQIFAYEEGAPKHGEAHKVKLPLFSSMEFQREEYLDPSITLCVDRNQIKWIYKDLHTLENGVIPSISAFFEAFGLKAGLDEYTEKFNDFMFTKEQIVQLREWKAEDHPYLDDDVELRDYLYLLLMDRLDLANAAEPYNSIIFDWLKL